MRHGTTCYQTTRKNRVYPKDGRDFPGLTASGKKLVADTAQKVKELAIDIIYASDFRRTRETAEIVAKIAGIKKIVFSSKLRDVNLGVYHDGPKQNFYKDFPNFREDWSLKPKGGESLSQAKERMVKFLNSIDKNDNILIISHGEPLWVLNPKSYIQPGELRRLNYE